MSPQPFQTELLTDIERRQDDLLRRLDDLNAQIEQVLSEVAPRLIAAEGPTS